MKVSRAACALVVSLAGAVLSGQDTSVRAPGIPVLHREVAQRRALVLTALDGRRLADGELQQAVEGERVTTRVVFRFPDGSLHDETVVFSQSGRFRLVSDRLVQRGPAFQRAIAMEVDGQSGRVTVRHAAGAGREAVEEARFDVPANLANGMVPTMLKNLPPGGRPDSLWLVVATPTPRLIRLAVRAETVPFRTDAGELPATRFVLKPELGGVAGWLAPLVGRRPPDSEVLILQSDTPAFIRSEQPLYVGGPLWRIDVHHQDQR